MRPSWDDYFLGITSAVSRRGECSRRQVGAIIVNDERRILGTGYNGAEAQAPSCLTGACPRANSNVKPGSDYSSGPGRCIAIHAERNAILFVERFFGSSGCIGTTLYCTDELCYMCSSLTFGYGIKRVVFPGQDWLRNDSISSWLVVERTLSD